MNKKIKILAESQKIGDDNESRLPCDNEHWKASNEATNGVEPCGFGGIFIAAGQAGNIQNRCANALIDWWHEIQHLEWSAANLMSVSNFPSSQGCHFPTEENRLVFKSQGSHVPTSQNLIPVPTKVAWEYLARVGRTREYYSICIKYPGFLHTWGIYPLGGDWYPSKCCCFPAAYVEVIQNGTE